MKKLLFSLSIFLIGFFSYNLVNPDIIQAQSCSCAWRQVGAGGAWRCVLPVAQNNCGTLVATGCTAANSSTDTQAQCEAPSRCVCVGPSPTPAGGAAAIPPYDPCGGVENVSDCQSCVTGGGAWTALGCISADPSWFAIKIISILFGLAGGVAFLLMIYGAFLCIVSRGDPQKAQACKETITAAVVGLIMLIFSLFIIWLLFGPNGIFGNIPGLETIFPMP